ncbi:hypothetical protein [Janibacter sp. DB-40]|uniref:hypothetical protein n=1 Tax=Janibacter sp. DB-40 TaxID=3028808 RepID=UPI00240697DD|nr:hypothetical protein [Janibacter sp. DB-40]
MQVFRPIAVIAAGAGLAFVLAAAALWAALGGFGMDPADWDPVAGTRVVLVCAAVVLVHGLWIVTWCAWRRLGWARFVAAVLLVPVTGLLTWLVVRSAWVTTTRGNGWSWGSQLLTQESTGTIPLVPVVLVPAVVVAVSVRLTVRVPARDPSESMFVRPAWRPRTLLRGTAVLGAVLGTVVLTAILVFLLLAMTGRV